MKKNVIIFGLIAGLIVAVLMIAAMAKVYNLNNYQGDMLLGYTSMLVAFSMIFVAVKNYRDKEANGVITFGKAFSMGLLITLIASTIYVVVWQIDYFYFIPDFFEKYSAHQLAELKATGVSAAVLNTKTAEMQHIGQLYRNPLFNAMYTYIEILPVGLIVSVLAAVILKRKPLATEAMLSI